MYAIVFLGKQNTCEIFQYIKIWWNIGDMKMLVEIGVGVVWALWVK